MDMVDSSRVYESASFGAHTNRCKKASIFAQHLQRYRISRDCIWQAETEIAFEPVFPRLTIELGPYQFALGYKNQHQA
jgi:hypothetical protein